MGLSRGHRYDWVAILVMGCAALAVSGSAAELPPDDFRISDMGPDGTTWFGASNPAVAFNAADHEVLVLWRGSDGDGSNPITEWEIYGQRIDLATGVEVGANDFRVTHQGPDGDINYAAQFPAVAWDSSRNSYFATWRGVRSLDGGDHEYEIYGTLLAPDGTPVGNAIRISSMGPDDNADFLAGEPAVTYSAAADVFYVAWYGDDAVDDEIEIYAQRVDAATGALVGGMIRVSHAGPDGDTAYAAYDPDVVAADGLGEVLIVWDGTDDAPGLGVGESEVFGQRLDAATGAEVGADDFRISFVGPAGNGSYDAAFPVVAFEPTSQTYMVVYYGDDLVDNEFEVYARPIDAATGALLGSDDLRLSWMGPDGAPIFAGYGAFIPDVAYLPATGSFIATWYGMDADPGAWEFEIFSQELLADGSLVGQMTRVSSMGTDGDTMPFGQFPAITAGGATALVTWEGSDTGESEIWGQRLASENTTIFADGFEAGDPSAWSAVQP